MQIFIPVSGYAKPFSSFSSS